MAGVIFSSVGIVLGFITLLVWRKTVNKAPIKLNGRMLAITVFGIIGALTLGIGMCLIVIYIGLNLIKGEKKMEKSKFVKANEKIAEGVTTGFKKI